MTKKQECKKGVSEMAVFWMNEASGQMKEIVMKFIRSEKLDEAQLETLKWYMIQWIEKAAFHRPIGYRDIINVSTQEELSKYVGVLLDYGIDPF